MPTIDQPQRRMKRTKKQDKKPGGKKRTVAIEVIKTITSDESQDWTIAEIAKEAKRKDLIPAEVFDDAMRKAVTNWLSENGRREKKNVGTKDQPEMIRVFGVYYVSERNEDGDLVERPCWREWEKMERWQRVDADQRLFKMSKKMRKETIHIMHYISKLEVNAGRPPVLIGEVS